MLIKMVALKTFLGRGNEHGGDPSGAIRGGRPFTCDNETRAAALEAAGLARRAKPARAAGSKKTENKAASAGPLSSTPGGNTGEAAPSSSSLPGLQPQPQRRRSRPRRNAKTGQA